MEYELKIDVSPVYELLDSFMLYVTRKWISNLDIGPHWISDVEDRISPHKVTALMQAAEWPLRIMMCYMPGFTFEDPQLQCSIS